MTRGPVLTAAEGLAGMVAAVALLVALVPFAALYAAGVFCGAVARAVRR